MTHDKGTSTGPCIAMLATWSAPESSRFTSELTVTDETLPQVIRRQALGSILSVDTLHTSVDQETTDDD